MELFIIVAIWIVLASIAFLLIYSIGKINKEYEEGFYDTLTNKFKNIKEDVKLIYCGADNYKMSLYSGCIYDTRLWISDNKIYVEVKLIKRVIEYNNIEEFKNNWNYLKLISK